VYGRLKSNLPMRAKTRRQAITSDGTPGFLCLRIPGRRQAAIFSLHGTRSRTYDRSCVQRLHLAEGTSPREILFLCAHEAGNTYSVPLLLPNVFLLMWQRRVATGNGLSTCLSITIKFVRRTVSGAAGNGLGTTIKCE
jgi:hypothetical protein